jgi:hypothetical protein
MSRRASPVEPSTTVQEDDIWHTIALELEDRDRGPRRSRRSLGADPAPGSDVAGGPSTTDGHDADEEAAENPGRCRCCLQWLRNWLRLLFQPGGNLVSAGSDPSAIC